MITRPRATKTKDARTLLICNGRNCMEVEEFERSITPHDIAKWCKRNGWIIIHRGGHLFDHRCPSCERRRRGLPADYCDRLHA